MFTTLVQAEHATKCSGKKQYPSFTEANRSAKLIGRRRDGTFSPYRCRVCQSWHVGNSTHSPKTLKTRSYDD
jgi:hypothetical protein